MKKSLAALLALVALCVPALAGVMETGPGIEEPPPSVVIYIAPFVVPAIVQTLP